MPLHRQATERNNSLHIGERPEGSGKEYPADIADTHPVFFKEHSDGAAYGSF
jgi:hypothetical protein